jgi:hypothetical protein
VELRGLDVYELIAGEIRSSEPGQADCDIACWSIDTDYNELYKKLQRPLKAEIEEEAWSSL